MYTETKSENYHLYRRILCVLTIALLGRVTSSQFVSSRRLPAYHDTQKDFGRRGLGYLSGYEIPRKKFTPRFQQRNYDLGVANYDTFSERGRPRSRFGNSASQSFGVSDYRLQNVDQPGHTRQLRLSELRKNQERQEALLRQQRKLRQQQLQLEDQLAYQRDQTSYYVDHRSLDRQERRQDLRPRHRYQPYQDGTQSQGQRQWYDHDQSIPSSSRRIQSSAVIVQELQPQDVLYRDREQTFVGRDSYQRISDPVVVNTVITDTPAQSTTRVEVPQRAPAQLAPSNVNLQTGTSFAVSPSAVAQSQGPAPAQHSSAVAPQTQIEQAASAVAVSPAAQAAARPITAQPAAAGMVGSLNAGFGAMTMGVPYNPMGGGMPVMGGMPTLGGMSGMGGMAGMGGMPGMGGLHDIGGMSPMGGMPGMGAMYGMPGMNTMFGGGGFGMPMMPMMWDMESPDTPDTPKAPAAAAAAAEHPPAPAAPAAIPALPQASAPAAASNATLDSKNPSLNSLVSVTATPPPASTPAVAVAAAASAAAVSISRSAASGSGTGTGTGLSTAEMNAAVSSITEQAMKVIRQAYVTGALPTGVPSSVAAQPIITSSQAKAV